MASAATPPTEVMPPAPRAFSRRRLLRWGVGGSLLLGAGAVVWRMRGPAPRASALPPVRLTFLSAREAAIFASVAARLLDPGDVAGAAPPDLAHTVAFFDRFVLLAHPEVQSDLRALLAAFDGIGPLAVGVPGRFIHLDAEEQDRVLRRWEGGPHPMRMGFTALKQLAFMGHYGRDATWPAIGYDGPIVPRGYAGGERGWLDPAWVAPPGHDGVGPEGRKAT